MEDLEDIKGMKAGSRFCNFDPEYWPEAANQMSTLYFTRCQWRVAEDASFVGWHAAVVEQQNGYSISQEETEGGSYRAK